VTRATYLDLEGFGAFAYFADARGRRAADRT